MLKIFQATIRKTFLVSQNFLIDFNFFKWEAPVAGIRLSLSKATIVLYSMEMKQELQNGGLGKNQRW